MALAAPSLHRTKTPISLPISLLEWWHLLSLDAATVAGLWSFAFARFMGVHLSVLAPLLLAAGTWLVYVVDRILDGLHPQAVLRRRHYFYAAHRREFMAAALAIGSCLGWLILTRMQSEVRREDTLLFLIALIYFALIHTRGRRVERWLPKELAVGVIFALATAIPTWARLSVGRERLLMPVALFAALCWLNCVAIESWEQPTRLAYKANFQERTPHASTRWAAAHLPRLWIGIGLAAALLGTVSWFRSNVGPDSLYWAACASATLFVVLERAAPRLSSIQLRIAADAALLTPILFLPFTRG